MTGISASTMIGIMIFHFDIEDHTFRLDCDEVHDEVHDEVIPFWGDCNPVYFWYFDRSCALPVLFLGDEGQASPPFRMACSINEFW
jgi:hypothetical protein